MSTNLPLPQYYARTLRALLPIFDDTLPLSDPETQTKLSAAIDDMYLISRMLRSLGVWSDNESASELSDRALLFMSAPWVLAEAEAKSGLGGHEERKAALGRSETAFTAFNQLLNTYRVLQEGDGEGDVDMAAPPAGPAAIPTDPAARRDAKIRAYKAEKELREKISAAIPGNPPASSSPLAFILALLPQETESTVSVNEEEPDVRSAVLLLLRFLSALTGPALANNAMEMAVLASAPPEPTQGPLEDPRAKRTAEEEEWRLDRKPGSYRPRELISGGGRVLRPFTILPSTSSLSDRERLRSEVFRSSHRLPTMTIDEYLAEEQARGNIITGGGQASYDKPTESELLELEAENDGSAAAEEAAEKKRLKDENWAQFTDDNKRGAGNTTNRG